MNDTLKTPMLEATRLTLAGRLSEATQIIQRALSEAGASEAGTSVDAASPLHRTVRADADKDACMVIDGCVFEIDAPAPPERQPQPRPGPFAPAPASTPGNGEFVNGSFTQGALTRAYKLYVPPHAEDRSLPLVVMLHGCTQNPDDFAAGTGMNERAREQGFFVLYPAQSQEANPSRCWNWFKHNHQQRGRGEPALIAGLTQAVIKQHGIDVRRVYVAGLSAGGAMAAIVAEAYPEIFAAAGVHSGLPRGAANGLPEALAVMKEGGPGNAQASSARAAILRPAALPPRPLQASVVPTIVFHGDHDQTVHPRNGERVVAALLGGAAEPASNNESGRARVEQGLSPQGRRYTRSVHVGDDGTTLAEHWLVHGAGHAWSGGHAEGSYTDARGPDATGEMLRFFFERPRGAAH